MKDWSRRCISTMGIQFKRKSNEKQHQFNESVLDKLEVAQKSLSSTPPAVERAKEALGEGEQLIKNRQKLYKNCRQIRVWLGNRNRG